MIVRTYDPVLVEQAVRQYADKIVGLDYDDWLEDEDNIAFTDLFGNVSMFEYDSPGVYYGHYFFHERGRSAVDLAKNMLWRVFQLPGIQVIKGLTPITNLGARWLSRHIGFNSHGLTDTKVGLCEIFILTKEEYNKKEGF